ncbi:OmpA family protein [Parvibaculum sp.]|uniref:OmpA family protein n=1 Tax=Parvibaculum sp. TaxID=2024848 RepID=UPI00391ABE73
MTSSRENTARAASGAAPFTAFASLLVALLLCSTGATAAEAPLPPPRQALLTIIFEGAGTTLGQTAREQLDSFSAEYARKGGRLELRAYAGPPHDKSSNSRRLSLRRALTVRHELVERGIVAERIHVRAMGGVSDSGPQDRVDISLPGG